MRGHYGEGRAWLLGLLEREQPGAGDARARALTAAFVITYRMGDYALARVLCEECLALQRSLGNVSGVASSLGYLAMVVGELGDIERSRALLVESLDLSREIGDTPAAVRALNSLGEIARIERDLEQAATRYEESLALARSSGDRHYESIVLHNLAYVARARRDAGHAAGLFRESLTLSHALGNQDLVASCLAGLASVATEQGDYRCAARLFAAADAFHRAIGAPEDAADELELQRSLEVLRNALGEDAMRDEWAAGSALSLEDAIDEALASPRSSQPSEPAPSLAALSPREQEVAALVARGLTNQQVATALGVSARTADTHVSRILRKLGVRSRSEVRDLV
jgi:DNA-binding CsgD family transcriptional regulator